MEQSTMPETVAYNVGETSNSLPCQKTDPVIEVDGTSVYHASRQTLRSVHGTWNSHHASRETLA